MMTLDRAPEGGGGGGGGGGGWRLKDDLAFQAPSFLRDQHGGGECVA